MPLKLRGSWLKHLAAGLLLAGSALVLFVWRLQSSTLGLSSAEAAAAAGSQYLSAIARDPLNWPQRLLQYGLGQIDPGPFWLRLASVLVAIAFLLLFYGLARRWFGRFVALLSTLLLAGTPWFILAARDASPVIMLLSPLAVVVAYQWLRSEANSTLAWLALVVLAAVTLYVPAGVWFLTGAGLVARRTLKAEAIKLGRARLIAVLVIGLLLIAPLIAALFFRPWLWHQFVALPNDWPTPLEAIKAIGQAASALVFRAPYHIDIILGRLPLLSIAQIALSLFGAVALWSRARKTLYGLAAMIAGSIILAGLNRDLYLLTLGLPAAGLLTAAGLRYLYAEWRSVFPRNPIPRALAVTLICLLVGLHLLHGARYSLVAWPHSLDTRNSYVLK